MFRSDDQSSTSFHASRESGVEREREREREENGPGAREGVGPDGVQSDMG